MNIQKLIKIVILLIVFIFVIYPCASEIFNPNIVQRFRIKDIYLGMTVDELREMTDGNKHKIFKNCSEKRNFEFGYMYCLDKEAGFRFDKNGLLTRYWFGIKQAEIIFNKKFMSQKEFVIFVKSRFKIKKLIERDIDPEFDTTSGKKLLRKKYLYEFNRSGFLEIDENSTLIVGKKGIDSPIRYD